MQLFYDIFPVFIFFIAFKFFDIYIATIAGIVCTFIQVILTKLLTKKWDNKQLITLGVFTFFGGLTLYFHNPIFVKWKPTIIFWVFSLVILFTQYFTSKPLMQRMMEKTFAEHMTISAHIWRNINLSWGIFFIFLGTLNLYIAYTFNNDTWVNFKFYGITIALFIFSFIQACFLARLGSTR